MATVAARAVRSAPERLRVGVVAAAPLQPRWSVEALARAEDAGVASVWLVAAGGDSPAPRRSLLARLDRRAFGRVADPETPVALPEKWLRGPLPALDLVFVLGEARLPPLPWPRYGVWRFGFAEDAPHVVAALAVEPSPDAPPRLACEGWSRRVAFSDARTREHVLAKCAGFAARALADARTGGEAWLARLPPTPRALAPELAPAARLGREVLRRGLEKALGLEQWSLRYRFGDGRPFSALMPPKDRDWADPFALRRDGRHYVFFEELPYEAGRAHISMVELSADGRASEPVKALERPWHLSYPFVFAHEGELYMVPESARNATVDLYRCVEFPSRWRLERTLLGDVRLADATLHRDASGWWLFAGAAPEGSRVFDDELHLYHAPRLDGEWRAHPMNPVKSDVRSSRPAGALFRRAGRLFRPAQICAPIYGSGVAVNEVLRLDASGFDERVVERLLPEPGLLGLHTYNRAGTLTVIDGFRRRRRI